MAPRSGTAAATGAPHRPPWMAAVRAAPAALLLDLQVSPGAAADVFPAGLDPWRRRIGVRVAAPAQDGKANAAVCGIVSERLGLPRAAVALASGATSTQKTLRIDVSHADPDEVLARLGALMAAAGIEGRADEQTTLEGRG